MSLTKIEKFNAIAQAVANVEFEFDAQEFLAKEIAKIEKANSRKSSAPTKAQRENAVLREKMFDEIQASTDGLTASELAELMGFASTQKVVGNIRPLITDGKVLRVKAGKVMRYVAVVA